MNTILVSTLWVHASAQLTRRLATVLGLMLLTLLLLSSSMLSAYAGLGGYISESLLGDNATPNASLYLGDSAEGPVVLGTVPAIATRTAINVQSVGGVSSATLRGNLANLNGMPEADVWFVWGYNAAAMGNATPVVTVAAIGQQAVNIAGMNMGVDVFYQFRGSTDGIARGGTLSFLSGGAQGASYWFITTLLPLIIAMGILIFIIKLTGNPIAALIAAVIGLIAFTLVQEMSGILG